MASSKEYLEFVMDQLSSVGDVSYRAMMGEYVIYYRGKVIGGIFDNRFLVKDTKSAKQLMPDAPMEYPYEGARPMIAVDSIDNRDFMAVLLNSIFEDIPEPKRGRPRSVKN